jgi:predicted NBD/HSP70 family sugar kinase
VTRSEIAHTTGLTRATVTHGVGELIDSGVVEELGRRSTDRGQPPIELRIRPRTAYTIGVHHGHRVINVVLSDLDGTVLERDAFACEPAGPTGTVEALADGVQSALRTLGDKRDHLLGVGLATFGPLDLRDGTVSPPIYGAEWQHQPLRRMLAEAIGVPVWLDNDAVAAAIGEFWYGAARAYDDFLMVFLGYGLGGGLFLGGRVHRGAGFNAAEIGHMIVDADGAPWFHGPPGSLESEVSLLRLERDLGSPPPLGQHLAGSDDPRVLAWLDRAGRRLAQATASADHLLDLEAVVFGGLVDVTTLEVLVERVRRHVRRFGIDARPQQAELVVGTTGPFSSALGAAMLPIYDAFLPARSDGMPSDRAFSEPRMTLKGGEA